MVLGTIKERVGGKCRAALYIVIYLEVTTLAFCAQCDGLCYFYVDVSFQVQEVCLWVKERQRSSQDFFKKVVTNTKKRKRKRKKKNLNRQYTCHIPLLWQPPWPGRYPWSRWLNSQRRNKPLKSFSASAQSGLVTSRVGKYLCICWKVPVLISLISGKLNFLSFFFFLCLYVLKAQGDNVIYFPSDQGKKNLVFFM